MGLPPDRRPPDPPQRRTARLHASPSTGRSLAARRSASARNCASSAGSSRARELELAGQPQLPAAQSRPRGALRPARASAPTCLTHRRRAMTFDSAYRSMVDGDYPRMAGRAGVLHAAGLSRRPCRRPQRRTSRDSGPRPPPRAGAAGRQQSDRARSTRWAGPSCSCKRHQPCRCRPRPVEALRAAYEADKADFFVVLDAHRRYAEAMSSYYQARVDMPWRSATSISRRARCWSTATSPWPRDHGRGRPTPTPPSGERLRGRPRRIDFTLRRPPLVSQGPSPPPASDGVVPGGARQSRSDRSARQLGRTRRPPIPARGRAHCWTRPATCPRRGTRKASSSRRSGVEGGSNRTPNSPGELEALRPSARSRFS